MLSQMANYAQVFDESGARQFRGGYQQSLAIEFNRNIRAGRNAAASFDHRGDNDGVEAVEIVGLERHEKRRVRLSIDLRV